MRAGRPGRGTGPALRRAACGRLYTLDFRAIKEQAERLKRERAVERVRAEAMAMRSSDDLLKVVAVLFDELKRDDPDRRWCNINFFDEETDQVTQYNGVDNPKLYAPVELAPDVLGFSDDVIELSLNKKISAVNIRENRRIR